MLDYFLFVLFSRFYLPLISCLLIGWFLSLGLVDPG